MGQPIPDTARPAPPPGWPLVVERVTVGARRIDAIVRVADERSMRTSAIPGLAEEVLALLPGLHRHRCECGSAHGIAAELADTELAHLLEHVTLEIAALAGSPRTLAGETRWDFAADGRGVFRISVDYDDDLVMLAALREGAALLAALSTRVREGGATVAAPDDDMVAGAVERVQRMREEGSRIGS